MAGARPTAIDARDYSPLAKKSPPLHVLVVDDEPLIRWALSETLSDRGCEVVEAGDGLAARVAIRDASDAFDVVLLDFRLPDSDDLSLLASIRRLAPDTPVILMTAYGSPEVIRGALDLGAFSVLHKPFELQDVATIVSAAADRR